MPHCVNGKVNLMLQFDRPHLGLSIKMRRLGSGLLREVPPLLPLVALISSGKQSLAITTLERGMSLGTLLVLEFKPLVRQSSDGGLDLSLSPGLIDLPGMLPYSLSHLTCLILHLIDRVVHF